MPHGSAGRCRTGKNRSAHRRMGNAQMAACGASDGVTFTLERPAKFFDFDAFGHERLPSRRTLQVRTWSCTALRFGYGVALFKPTDAVFQRGVVALQLGHLLRQVGGGHRCLPDPVHVVGLALGAGPGHRPVLSLSVTGQYKAPGDNGVKVK